MSDLNELDSSLDSSLFSEESETPGLIVRRSDIQDMLSCPRRHKARKDGLLPQTDAMRMGELIHQVVTGYLGWLKVQSLWSDPDTLLEEGRKVLEQQEEARLQADVMGLLQSCRHYIRVNPNTLLDVEAQFDIQVEDALTVTFRADVLENIEEGVAISDWKSGWATMDKAEARRSFQTLCYSAGIARSYGVEQVHFTYRFLRYHSETTVILREQQLQEAYWAVVNGAKEYRRRLDEEDWPAKPCHLCSSCELAPECLAEVARPQRQAPASPEEFESLAKEFFVADGARSRTQKLIQAYVKQHGSQSFDGRRFSYESAAPRWGVRKDSGGEE